VKQLYVRDTLHVETKLPGGPEIDEVAVETAAEAAPPATDVPPPVVAAQEAAASR
jgi:hypothetical protein